MTRPSAPVQAVAGLLVAGAAVGTLLWGRAAVSGFVAIVALVAYLELRRVLNPGGLRSTMAVGALAVLAWLWVGYEGHLERLPWVGGALVLLLLVVWVISHEVTGRAEGATQDVAATVVAAGIVGVFGAHVLLIRAVEHSGFRGLLAFGLMVLVADGAALVADRVLGRPRREVLLTGFGGSIAVGVTVGLMLDPPFDLASGAAFGAGLGVLVPIGGLAFETIRHGGTRRAPDGARSGESGLVSGALDAVLGLLFAAPAFYWAFRTIAL